MGEESGSDCMEWLYSSGSVLWLIISWWILLRLYDGFCYNDLAVIGMVWDLL